MKENNINLKELTFWIESVNSAEKSLFSNLMSKFWDDYAKINKSFESFSGVIVSDDLVNSIPDDIKIRLAEALEKLESMQLILDQKRTLLKKRINGKKSLRKIAHAYNNPGTLHGRNLKLTAGR